jgi:NTE family protein
MGTISPSDATASTGPKQNRIQINPLGCQETPNSEREILNRINEITFNANLLSELRAIEFVGRMLEEGSLDPTR